MPEIHKLTFVIFGQQKARVGQLCCTSNVNGNPELCRGGPILKPHLSDVIVCQGTVGSRGTEVC